MGEVRTRFLMPPCWRMARRARLNRAMLAMVSAERQRSSALESRRILTIVVSPPRSVIVRRIIALVLISFRIFSAPICADNNWKPKQSYRHTYPRWQCTDWPLYNCVTLTFDLLISRSMHAMQPCHTSTKFSVDSCFSSRARTQTDRQTDTKLQTPLITLPTHWLLHGWVQCTIPSEQCT